MKFGELELTPEDIYSVIRLLISRIKGKKKPLKLKPADLIAKYSGTPDIITGPKKYKAPYQLLFDYNGRHKDDWGQYEFTGQYDLPNELESIKLKLIKLFTAQKLLGKGDKICPRVHSYQVSEKGLLISIQQSGYFDQVATNLSLDYVLDDIDAINLEAPTLRDWDQVQSGTAKNQFPPFEQSKLANTIGVALAITARNKKNEEVILVRKRTSKVAVMAKSLVLPLSFSLNIEPKDAAVHPQGNIYDLIKSDFRAEQKEELGMEETDIDFDKVKPLMFCRELLRGGKPQLFFEVEMDISYEKLKKQIKEKTDSGKEFTGSVKAYTLNEAYESIDKFSQELAAYVIYKKNKTN